MIRCHDHHVRSVFHLQGELRACLRLLVTRLSVQGKFVIVLEDDLKETEAEGQVDILSNRVDVWKDKGVKYAALFDDKCALLLAFRAASQAELSTVDLTCPEFMSASTPRTTKSRPSSELGAFLSVRMRLSLIA